ncbi:hypothetical protein Tco_0860384 [Tanacetum coccineum]|uniref:Uncharacterized protein n=1 Tax=Tanacetum coccineum TaxID=301880 RepID=A0ABQ5BHT3_9ASTR
MLSSKLNFRKGVCNFSIKNELRKLTGNSVNTKFARTSILGKPILHTLTNQSVVRQPTVFKSERPKSSKPRFSSQADMKTDLSKSVTTHYLTKGKESACAKPHQMITPGSSRYSSNDMVHNHYLKETKKKTQQNGRNSEPMEVPSARSQSTSNDSKLKPRIKVCRIFKAVGLRWVPTGKIFTSSTTKVDSEAPHGSNTNITNLHECMQTLDSSANTSINVQEEQTLDLSASTPFNLKKERIKAWIKENVISGRPRGYYALRWKPCQGDSSKLNLPDHRYKWRCCSLIPTKSDSLPHAHAQTTKTYYQHQDSRIKKAQELKTKTFARWQ